MFKMLLRSRRYAGRFFKRRSWDFSTPQKVPNPYGAGYTHPQAEPTPTKTDFFLGYDHPTHSAKSTPAGPTRHPTTLSSKGAGARPPCFFFLIKTSWLGLIKTSNITRFNVSKNASSAPKRTGSLWAACGRTLDSVE